MTFINWDQTFDLYGVPVPTYGLNGGLDWTLGSTTGSTLDQNGQPVKPSKGDHVDIIDKYFYYHDQAYELNPTASEIPQADLQLASSLVKLNDHQLSDPEASFYAGIVTLAMVYQIETNAPSLLSSTQALYFTQDAVHNIERGLAGLSGSELLQAAAIVTDPDFSTLLGSLFSPFAATTTVSVQSNPLDPTLPHDVLMHVSDNSHVPDGALSALLEHAPSALDDVQTLVEQHTSSQTHEHSHWLV